MPNSKKPDIEEQNIGEEQQNGCCENSCECENCAEQPVNEKAAKKAQNKKKAGGEDVNVRLAALEEQLAASEEKEAQTKESLMRTAAEYENYRKRSQKETEEAFSRGVSHAVLELLAILDVLEVAEAAPTQDEEYKKGVTLTLAKSKEVFAKLGVEEIDCQGKQFDPEYHNALMQEDNDEFESGCVTKVLKKGYVNKNGKVVRHACVCVKP